MIVETVRGLNRAHVGPSFFDALPPDAQHVGALIFDGHMAELHPNIDDALAVSAINTQLAQRHWDYEVVIKPNSGLEDFGARASMPTNAPPRMDT